jgi:hypothetical protein
VISLRIIHRAKLDTFVVQRAPRTVSAWSGQKLKANTTNFRIARRSLPISRAYLRTIEKTPTILLVSLLVGRADYG